MDSKKRVKMTEEEKKEKTRERKRNEYRRWKEKNPDYFKKKYLKKKIEKAEKVEKSSVNLENNLDESLAKLSKDLEKKAEAEEPKNFWKELREKPRREFEKKSSSEKFSHLFEEMECLEETIEEVKNDCCDCNCGSFACDCVEKSEMEEFKNEIYYKLEILEEDLEELKEQMEKLLGK